MIEIFKYYLSVCDDAIIHQYNLLFNIVDYQIIFHFSKEIDDDEDYDDELFSFNTVNNIETITELLKKNIHFLSYTIQGSEYLGDRGFFLEEGRSITNEMYDLLKNLNFYQKDSVLSNSIDIDYGDIMCNSEGNYQFNIKVNKTFWGDLGFAKHLYSLLMTMQSSIPSFYNKYFKSNTPIDDTKVIPILSTNTKVRRLGYFKILSFFLTETKQIPTRSINKKFENYCLKYIESLENYKFNKGLIKETKTGISAKPYIDLAIDLEILNKINNVYLIGKPFKVYQVIQKVLIDSENVFQLTTFDKLYFLECILKNDFFYFNNLLEILYTKERITYLNIIELYQNKLIDRLESYRSQTTYLERKVINDIDQVISRIKSWEKPNTYLEHIIMPRLNWMLDLGIISWESNEFQITEIGSKLFSHFCVWNDINTKYVISPNNFLNRFAVHVFNDCYDISKSENTENLSVITQKMYKYIDDSFDLFKTLAPNRVTASQSINYSKYMLYLNDQIKTGYQFIFRELSENKQDQFIFKYQKQYQDGYIQKRNKNDRY